MKINKGSCLSICLQTRVTEKVSSLLPEVVLSNQNSASGVATRTLWLRTEGDAESASEDQLTSASTCWCSQLYQEDETLVLRSISSHWDRTPHQNPHSPKNHFWSQFFPLGDFSINSWRWSDDKATRWWSFRCCIVLGSEPYPPQRLGYDQRFDIKNVLMSREKVWSLTHLTVKR